MNKQKQKENISSRIAKTALAIVIITGLGTIIFGGGVVIMKYYGNEANNKTMKPVNQETEDYYDVLEKKCGGESCCLSSLKIMKDNNYKEADKNYKCPDGFKLGGLRCVSSLSWCESIEGCVDNQNNHREIGEIWSKSSTMFTECNKFGNILINYVLSCGEEKLIISDGYSSNENNINRTIPSSPFFIGTNLSLKYTWVIDGNKYASSSGGPTGVFASCENEKATIFNFGGMGRTYYTKTFFDGDYKTEISCLDSYSHEEEIYDERVYDENDPKNFTISKFEDGGKLIESKTLENGKEICQEIKKRYQELEKTIIDTSDWQTYRNEKFGFEVKYPEEWIVFEKNHTYINIHINKPGGIVIEIYPIDSNNNLDSSSSSRNNIKKENGIFNLREISIGGAKGIAYDSIGVPKQAPGGSMYIFEKNGYIIHMYFDHYETDYNQIRSDILSTFKFTEK